MAPSFFESPETAITAVISAVVCVLVATYPHAAIFYVRRVLAELWLIFAQLRYIGLTDQGSLLSWPFVQRELRLLLDIEKIGASTRIVSPAWRAWRRRSRRCSAECSD